jgi:hypothetical protein
LRTEMMPFRFGRNQRLVMIDAFRPENKTCADFPPR